MSGTAPLGPRTLELYKTVGDDSTAERKVIFTLLAALMDARDTTVRHDMVGSSRRVDRALDQTERLLAAGDDTEDALFTVIVEQDSPSLVIRGNVPGVHKLRAITEIALEQLAASDTGIGWASMLGQAVSGGPTPTLTIIVERSLNEEGH